MGTRWRRAFCTAVPTEKEAIAQKQHRIPENASPGPVRSCVKLGIFSSISNPSTPRLHSEPSPNIRCLTGDVAGAQSADNTTKLQCKTTQKKPTSSNPSSPRSPFSILKSTLRLSKSGCGVCLQSVKTGQGMAIYTAECSHSFHFPCISQRVGKQGSMVCPVCNCTWKDLPLFSAHKKTHPLPVQDDVVEKTITVTDDKRIQSSITAVKTKTKHDESKLFDDTSTSGPYNDDEPLLYPGAGGGRFNPIPEVEDEDNEDVEEFQGFFVDSTPSTPTPKFVHGWRTQRNVEVKLLPEAAVVSVGGSHETFAVALRVKAPPLSADGGFLLSPSHRAPVDVVAVLEVSGTMAGSKLHMLKRAMRLVISSLGSSDRLSIVAFSSSPQRLLPLRRMNHQGQRLARHIIDHLAVGHGKSLSSALKIAAKVLEDRREKNSVANIILLSDGQDELSQTVKRQSKSQVSSTGFGYIEIPVHSLGYGGGGNHDSVADAFSKRVGGLLSVVIQDLRLQLGLSFGSAVGEITAVYSCNGRPRSLSPDSTVLGDLYAEEERELLVELRVPTTAVGSHHVMSVRCSYRDPQTGELMYGRVRAVLVPHPRAAGSSDPRIERLRTVFLATRAVAEWGGLAERGEFGGAQQLLVSARTLVAQSGSASAEEYVRLLEAELAALHWRMQEKAERRQQEAVAGQQRRRIEDHHVAFVDENGEPLTPMSAWRAAEQLAKVAMMKKSLHRVSDLHGFENARF